MRPIEEGMLVKLGDLGSDLSRKLGRAYEEARERIFSDIVDGVIRAEPNFTDHGEPHIKDVLSHVRPVWSLHVWPPYSC